MKAAPLRGAGGGWPPWVSLPHRAGSGVRSLHWTVKGPPLQERLSLGPGDQASRGRTRFTSPRVSSSCRENEFPGRGLQSLRRVVQGFMVLSVGQGGKGAVHRAPLSLTGPPGWTAPPGETSIYVCPPEAHRRPPLLLGPGHYRPLLARGPSCTLYSVGCHSTARERSRRGSRGFSQRSVFALGGGQAVIGHPSLLSLHVLIPAFKGRQVP